MTFRSRLAAGLALAVLALGAGCSAIKATYKEHYSDELGREGWWKAEAAPEHLEAVRHGERVIVVPGPREGEFLVKIDPRTLSFPVPPSVIKVVSVESTGIRGEARVYAIPEGWTWERVRDWYLQWFDFKRVK